MPKSIKYALVAFAALLGLLVLGAAIVAATFDPNDYKPRIVRLVQEKTQRTLAIPGQLKLTFFPKLGIDLGRVSISERNSNEEFASVNSARLSVRLAQLLSKQLVVDEVRIDGLRASIRRFKDGTGNFDDFLKKEQTPAQAPAPGGEQVKLDIDSVHISNAGFLYDDQQQERQLEVTQMSLETGRIANGVPSKARFSANVKGNKPQLDARIVFNTAFTIDLEQRHFVLKGADADVKGKLLDVTDLAVKAGGDVDLWPDQKRIALDGVQLTLSGTRDGQPIEAKLVAPKLTVTDAEVSGGKLQGEARVLQGARTVMVNFLVPAFEGSPKAFKIPSLSLDANVKDTALDAKASVAGAFNGDIDKMLFESPQVKLLLSGKQGNTAIDGTLTTPVSANLTGKKIELPHIVAAFNLPNPGGGSLKFNAAGKAHADLDKQNLSAVLQGKLDESGFDAKLGMSRFSPAAYTFDIGIDRLDADRYRAKPGAAPQRNGPAPGQGNEQARAPGKEAGQPIDLSPLKDLNANGSVRVGALKVQGIRASNVRADLHAGGGKIDINPLAANLYSGSVNGSASATASAAPRIAIRQNLAGINLGPLLKDAIDKQPIEGRGNVQLDIATEGGSIAQIKKALNGSARMELHDGAVHGINVAKAIRDAKAKIGAIKGNAPAQDGTASQSEKTDFSELTGSFRIANGVARNDDLELKSPLIRVNGAGDVNVGDDRLDYVVKATVVSSLKGQGGPELESLKGLTVPVKLSGPFNAIAWKIDFGDMAGELAKQKLDEAVRSQAEKALGGQKGKKQDQIREGLKGLFGK